MFPKGMRVLAVDDDPACLMLLDALLRKCQYHVTMTNQAVKALEMLRENKERFDLVISDVQMPDMDGFKLLEQVGLEMDLPVIMLSACSDTKYVMKGITHGACDYLLKPVRIEELKNIWQHVIRRKKIERNEQNISPHHQRNVEDVHGLISIDNSDQNEKQNRKRKDQKDDVEEEGEENENVDEDFSSQKKPRVVWSMDLHQKFVAAVNQLGIEKAFPKRILDLMNVDGLTRENVASHLQKFRLYLKRISSAASQQTNKAAALGIKDPSFMRLNPLNEFTDFHNLSGPGRFNNVSILSYPHGGMANRFNTNFGNSRNLPGHVQSPCSPVSSFGKIQPTVFYGDQNFKKKSGVPRSLEFDQFQHSKFRNHIMNFNHINDPSVFMVSNANLINPLLHENTQFIPNKETFEPSISSRISEKQTSMVELPSNLSNTLLNSISSSAPHIMKKTMDFSSCSAVSLSLLASSREDIQCQEGLLRNVVQTSDHLSKKDWEGCIQDYSYSSSNRFGTFNSHVPTSSIGSLSQRQMNDSVPSLCQPSLVDKMIIDTRNKSSEDLMAMINQEQKETILMDQEFGVDAYSFG